tara:strand:+ start:5827 stop:6249 length:423 start_codon:yes stop_codon:yes gene_type:complete
MENHNQEIQSATYDTPWFKITGKYKAKCVSVYDGDTVQLVIWYNGLYKFSCRLSGFNSAEMRTKDTDERTAAVTARDALRDLILDKTVDCEVLGSDKYGRLLVDINTGDGAIGATGINIAEYMIKGGFGAPYDGTGKKSY